MPRPADRRGHDLQYSGAVVVPETRDSLPTDHPILRGPTIEERVGGFLLISVLVGAIVLLVMVMQLGPWSPKERWHRPPLALRNFGQTCLMYAESHEGRYPPDIDQLIEFLEATLPTPPPRADGSPPAPRIDFSALERAGAWYVPGCTLDSPPETIVAYYPDGDRWSGKILFRSGRIDLLPEYLRIDGANQLQGAVPMFPAR